jgi:hypothetical protein
MRALWPFAAVILSEAKDLCNRLRPHPSVILSEAKDLCNRLRPPSVILSEAKDLCNQIYPPVPPSARASSRPLVNHPILHNEIHFLQHRHIPQRIPRDPHNIRQLARLDRSDPILHAQQLRRA